MSKHKKTSKSTTSSTTKSQNWNLIILVVVVIALVLGYRYFKSAASDMPLEINQQQAFDEREKGAFMLDVRTQEEWEQFHIPDSTLIPLDELPDRLNELPHDQTIVVLCRTQNRSAQARDLLLQAGFENVHNVRGGVTDWKNAGYPTVSGP
jgi:rhodanese-related sulfurtransferase